MKRLSSVLVATIADVTDAATGERMRHNSPAWPLLEFFRRRADRATVLELSLPRPGMVSRPQASFFERGTLRERRVWPGWLTAPFAVAPDKAQPKTYFRLKARDILACFWAAAATPGPIDLFIGVESLLALCGAALKVRGKVRESAYYISDWSPWKFDNKLLNDVYIRLDKAACRRSDWIWNYTYAISDARRDILGYDMAAMGRELWVPFGFIPDGVTIRPHAEVDRRRLFYSGGICRENGVELIVEALPQILAAVPGATIDIFGDGPQLAQLQARAEALGVARAVVWHGYVTDRRRILDAALSASAALAPYMPFPENVKRFGDVIKIREAIGCGLPVITTEVPPSHREVRDGGLGAVIPYDAEILAKTVVSFLTDDDAYFTMRDRVVAASRDNLWDAIYMRTLAAMGYDATPRFGEAAS
ncbi:glycosyltransferase [Solidesulfovibrio sp.]|uniref:glycosyltransferase n=1 Tax=Solidesulfovibrio sp. TaxID=2910990 RepID=UPI0026030CEB|nr:glycosyltransferase [Solidesulfovibrio sp.]